MDESDIDRQLKAATLLRATLENETLAHNLQKQRTGAAWYQLPIQLVPIVTALVSVAGFLWGVVQYTGEQEKNRQERERQSVREQATAEREFMKPWLESQRDIYEQALTAAAAAANARDAKDRATAEERFWQLYHGRMITVETREVSGGMVQVGRCLDGSDACDVDEMNARTRALATAMAGSMAATARMSYREFAENQFHYSGR